MYEIFNFLFLVVEFLIILQYWELIGVLSIV
jgi:hypothetical protein